MTVVTTLKDLSQLIPTMSARAGMRPMLCEATSPAIPASISHSTTAMRWFKAYHETSRGRMNRKRLLQDQLHLIGCREIRLRQLLNQLHTSKFPRETSSTVLLKPISRAFTLIVPSSFSLLSKPLLPMVPCPKHYFYASCLLALSIATWKPSIF
jgi:hypothetical protein